MMNATRENPTPIPALARQVVIWSLVLAGLYAAGLYHYDLWHCLAEFFSIIIAATLFLVAWNSRQIIDNNYLLCLGIGYLFVGGLDLLHTLSYKGIEVFFGYGANLPTHLWIGARYLEAVTLLLAPLFFKRRFNPYLALGCFALATVLFLLAVFGGVFPDSYLEGTGLTPFKIVSEYVICVILVGALALLLKNRSEFHPRVFTLMTWSIILTIVQELFFTLYVDVFGLFNLLGHYLKILSFYLVYKAVIQTGLMSPYDVLFRNLTLREEAIQNLNIDYVFCSTKSIIEDERVRGLRASGPLPPPPHPLPQFLLGGNLAGESGRKSRLPGPLKGWEGGVGGGQGAAAPWPSPHGKIIILFAEHRA